MNRLERAVSVDDVREAARRRVPRAVFDFFVGMPGHEIGRAVGVSQLTVYRWLKAGAPPTHEKPEQPRNVGAHEAYLTRRWAQRGDTWRQSGLPGEHRAVAG